MIDPNQPAQAMSSDANEELYRVLMATAEEVPLPVLADIFLALNTVMTRRVHDEIVPLLLGEEVVPSDSTTLS